MLSPTSTSCHHITGSTTTKPLQSNACVIKSQLPRIVVFILISGRKSAEEFTVLSCNEVLYYQDLLFTRLYDVYVCENWKLKHIVFDSIHKLSNRSCFDFLPHSVYFALSFPLPVVCATQYAHRIETIWIIIIYELSHRHCSNMPRTPYSNFFSAAVPIWNR